MPPGHLNLLLDQIKVIQQPFGGRSDTPALAHGQCGAIESSDEVLVLVQPRQQTVGTLPGDYLVAGCEAFGMARQLFDTEQLGPQRRLACARAQTRISGHPIWEAQWQILHFIFNSGRDSFVKSC
jgi:hypothetical protein